MPAKHPAPAFRHPAVSLRMVDGGEVSPWSLKGIANKIKTVTTKSPEEVEKERMRAEYIARNAAKPMAPAPAAAPSPIQTAAPMGSAAVLQRREAAAGLRNGGEVPGEGSGDKVPALYEPGEFVVSNDMLRKNPSLRGELHELREDALADKGMTPEEADAKAVGGAKLRAVQGFGGEDEQAKRAMAQLGPTSPSGVASGGGSPIPSNSVAGVPGGAVGGDTPGLPTASVTDSFMPRTRGGLRDAGVEMSQAVDEGKYAKATGKLFTGTLGAVKNVADDVLGGAARGAYGILRNPVEDFGRGALGLEDRQPTPTAPAVSWGGENRSAASRMSQPYSGVAPKPVEVPEGTPTLLGQVGREVKGTGAMRFDVQGKSPLYTDKASTGSSERMLSRPAMSENDPGMMGIQARQDNRMASLRQQAQFDQEVAAANEINARYKPREGFNRMQARLQSEASLRSDATARRGQDMELSGQTYTADQTARIARAQGQRDQQNKDRDYATGRDDKAFTQKQAADKSWNDHASTIFQTVDKDGKAVPDGNKIAAYTRAADETIGKMIPDLLKSGDPTKVAYGQKLASMGRAALDDQDKANMSKWFGRQQAHAGSYRNVDPMGASGDIQNDLRSYANPANGNGIFQPRTQFTGADGKPNGISIPNTALDYGPDANLWGWNGKPSNASLRQ